MRADPLDVQAEPVYEVSEFRRGATAMGLLVALGAPRLRRGCRGGLGGVGVNVSYDEATRRLVRAFGPRLPWWRRWLRWFR